MLSRSGHRSRSTLAGGAAPRVSPFPDLRDCAGLLQRAGFSLPGAGVEAIEIHYADPMRLLRDLHAAGETNATLLRSRKPPPLAALFAAALDVPERLPVTFRVAVVTEWTQANRGAAT